MCGIKELVILKIQAVSFLYIAQDFLGSRSDLPHEHMHNRGLGLRRETVTLRQPPFDHWNLLLTIECVALRMQNLPMPRHVQSYFPTLLFRCFVQAHSNYKSSDVDRLCRPCHSFTVNGDCRTLSYMLMMLDIEAGSVGGRSSCATMLRMLQGNHKISAQPFLPRT